MYETFTSNNFCLRWRAKLLSKQCWSVNLQTRTFTPRLVHHFRLAVSVFFFIAFIPLMRTWRRTKNLFKPSKTSSMLPKHGSRTSHLTQVKIEFYTIGDWLSVIYVYITLKFIWIKLIFSSAFTHELITLFSGEIEERKLVFTLIGDKAFDLKMSPYVRELDQLDDIYDNSSRFNRFPQVLLHCLSRVEEENTDEGKVKFLKLALCWFKRFSPCTDEEKGIKALVYNVLCSELFAQPNVDRHLNQGDFFLSFTWPLFKALLQFFIYICRFFYCINVLLKINFI